MASKQANIEVKRIHQRGKFWSVLDMDDQWYGFGMKKPPFDEGDVITFEYTKNGQYLNADITTVEIVSEGATKPAARAQSTSSGGNLTRDEYWANKEKNDVFTQREIRWAGARNAAIETVKLLMENDGLALSKVKPADKEQVIAQLIDTYTEQYFAETTAARDKTDVQAITDAMANTKNNKTTEEFEDDDLESLR